MEGRVSRGDRHPWNILGIIRSSPVDSGEGGQGRALWRNGLDLFSCHSEWFEEDLVAAAKPGNGGLHESGGPSTLVTKWGGLDGKITCGMVCRSRPASCPVVGAVYFLVSKPLKTLVAFSLVFSHNSFTSFDIFKTKYNRTIYIFFYLPQKTYSSLNWTDYPHHGVSNCEWTPVWTQWII